MADKSIAIIGAGVFGVSTALAWRRKYPTASVYLIDVKSRTPESAGQKRIIPASEDTAKIIRAAYASPEYADLAREALGLWQSESIYAKFFHKSGWVVPHTDEVRRTSTAAPISRERFEELYPEANIDTGCEITEDKEVGWVEASKCLEAVLETAIGKGVIYRSGEATELLWNGPRCVGVKLRDGQEINSESVVLATGCCTPKFLEQCHIPGVPCEVAGVTAVGIRLGEEEYERHKEMPILIIPARGDIMSPDRNRIIKINNATSFHAPDISNREISTTDSPYFEENIALLARFFPRLRDAQIAFRRYCFDLVTPAQDFIISAVPDFEGVYIATGGSFHGWKFLPNIGSYVVQMIEGTLSPPWSDRWKVNGTPSAVLIHRDIIPRRPFIA